LAGGFFTGYNEIQQPRERYAMIDYEELKELLNFKAMSDLLMPIEDGLTNG
jgi:hypothetical protein